MCPMDSVSGSNGLKRQKVGWARMGRAWQSIAHQVTPQSQSAGSQSLISLGPHTHEPHTLRLSDLVESCDVDTLHLWTETKTVAADCLEAYLLRLHSGV